MSVEATKHEIISLLNKVNRDGIDRLIEFLEKTDFFTAPASTKFHSNYEGGLADHSLNVYKELKDLTNGEWPEETIIVIGLLHDICKVNNYKTEMRNKKNPDTGVWYQEPYYTTDDMMPLGHGEKSVMLISEFIRLTKEELYAIRWHMGGYEPKENYSYISNAYYKYPLAVYTHMADLKATYIDEEIK
ncbi:MAG: HD domain-containing protein [Clostridia bacterium]|nr:HD domain-containing protein [Clostridia bacterium]